MSVMQKTDPLHKRAGELRDEIAQLRTDAGSAWTELEAAKKALAETSREELTPEHDVYKRFEAAERDYRGKSDRIADREVVLDGMFKAMGHAGVQPAERPGAPADVKAERRGALAPGDRIVEGDEYKQLVASGRFNQSQLGGRVSLGKATDRAELKQLLTGASDTSAGAFVLPDQIGYFPLVLRELTIVDLITVGTTNSDTIEYVEQTSFTNSAAPVAEATAVTGSSGTKPLSSTSFVRKQIFVKQLAHWMAATTRALADAGQLRTIIDSLLRYGLGRALEDQLVSGDGIGENLLGFLNVTGTNSIPAGSDSHADKIFKGMVSVQVDGFNVTGTVINPLDWQTIRLSRDDSGGVGTGQYLFGPPSQAGASTLWGRPVAISPAIPAGTALTGDLRAINLWLREGVQIAASDSHSDFFVRNLVAVRGEMRCAAGVIYPPALCEVDLTAGP